MSDVCLAEYTFHKQLTLSLLMIRCNHAALRAEMFAVMEKQADLN